MGIGVERKRIRDFLNSIDDGRYTGHQRVGMAQQYKVSVLIIEGYWRPDPRSGILLGGIPKDDGSMVWTADAFGGRTMYQKLRRYLFSCSLGGVIVLYTRDIAHTAYDITELYHYFQKPWREHKALLAMHHDTLVLPTLDRRPSVVRKWAFALDGIGMTHSEDAERVFKTPKALANGDELDWMRIEGVGADTARKVVRQILGVRR